MDKLLSLGRLNKNKYSVITLTISIVAFTFSIFHLYTAIFGNYTAIIQRGVHLTLALIIVFLITTPSKKWNNKFTKIYSWFLIFLAIGTQAYLLLNATPADMVARAVSGPTSLDIFVGLIVIILVFEGARRVSLPLAIVALCFILYGYFGNYMPGLIAHRGYSVNALVDYLSFSTEGLYGLPLGVSATIIAIFIIFGAFLEKSGGGKFFVDLAFAVTGRFKSGPALSAITASALMGSISGSAVANVSTTGTFTIPLMMKVGYKPHYAGAIEAAASTGGQLMPPIMGAGAFIMAEILGIPFTEIAIAAIIPAILYYLGIGWMVHLEAEKIGLKSIKKKDRPNFISTFKEGFHFFIPLVILVGALIVLGVTPTKAALYGIIAVIIVSFRSRASIMTPKKILEATINGAKGSVNVAIACATAGLIIGIFTLTGLGLKLSNLVIILSQGNLFIALILTMISCIILGMGLPTAAAYIITAALVAPALINLGVEPLAAHFFIFYFAIVSAITPPTALAAFAGAGIANANAMRTAFTATRLGIVAYVVPYMIIYGPQLLLIGSTGEIIHSTLTAVFGVIFLGIAVQGWFIINLNIIIRGLTFGVSIMMIKPGGLTDIIGIIGTLLLALFIYRHLRKVRFKEEEQEKVI